MKNIFATIAFLAIYLLSFGAHAQSTAAQVTPGFLSTDTAVCGTRPLPCWTQYSSTYPLPVSGSGGGGSGIVIGSTTVTGGTSGDVLYNSAGTVGNSAFITIGTSAATVNGVTLSTAGPSTAYLNELGTYSTPSGGGSATLGTSAAAPGPYSTASAGTGLYSSGASQLGVSIGSTSQLSINGTTAIFLNAPTVSAFTNAGPVLSSAAGLTSTQAFANSGSMLWDNGTGGFGEFTLGTYNGVGNSVLQAYNAAYALYQVTQALVIDPREYGAYCDANYFDGRNGSGYVSTTNGSNVISISGYTFTSGDVGKSIAITDGATNTNGVGIPVATIVSVNTGANTATISGTAPNKTVTQGYAVLAHDDTSAFYSAGTYSAQYHGSYVVVPNNCAVRDWTPTAGVTFKGQTKATGYGYGYADEKPVMYILATGYSSDTVHVGIDITNSVNSALVGFTIKAPDFPYLYASGPTMACVGTTSGTSGTAQAFLLDHMTIQNCPVAVGVPYGTSPGGYIFGQSDHSEFAANGAGFNGAFSDWQDIGSVFTDNFNYGVYLGPQGGAPSSAVVSRFIGTRFEENGVAVFCDGCGQEDFTGANWQFNGGYAVELSGAWNNMNITGGFMQGNGVGNTSGHRAHIALNGTGATGGLHISNVTFLQTNFSQGGATQYVLDGLTAGSANPSIDIEGGTVCTNGYSTGFATYASGAPAVLKLVTADCNQLITGRTDFSINSSSQVGIGTSSALNTLDVIGTGIHIGSGTPGTTTYSLYNAGGTLYWNGSAVGGGGGMVYPGAGIANSTGSAWGTSYTTSGTGTVLALTAGPTFTTPTLGVATATSLNGLTITSSTGTLTIANGKTYAVNNSLTFTGTDSTSFAFPSTSGTVATLGAANAFTGNNTLAGTTIAANAITVTPTTCTVSGSACATNYATSGNTVYVTLPSSATTTISNPTNSQDGGRLTFALTQGTSSVVSWGTNFDFGAAGAPTLSTTSGKVDYVGFQYNTNLSKWVYQGSVLGN